MLWHFELWTHVLHIATSNQVQSKHYKKVSSRHASMATDHILQDCMLYADLRVRMWSTLFQDKLRERYNSFWTQSWLWQSIWISSRMEWKLQIMMKDKIMKSPFIYHWLESLRKVAIRTIRTCSPRNLKLSWLVGSAMYVIKITNPGRKGRFSILPAIGRTLGFPNNVSSLVSVSCRSSQHAMCLCIVPV